MEQTTNYGLNKPGGSDYARIDVLNANMDAVDAALKELEESKAEGAALAAHEADGVKHVSAAERTAWNAKADGTATGAHIARTDNPHGVTAAQVGAVPLTGGTLTGNLDIAKTIASVVLKAGDLSGRLMKNANVEGTVDDGLYLTDYGADGSEATLKIQGGQQRLRIKLGGTDYAVYHEGSKPTPADIGAAAASHNHIGDSIKPGSLELSPSASASHGGLIDFHYNGDAADYTSRIIEDRAGRICLTAPAGVFAQTTCDLNTSTLRNISCGITDLIAGSSNLTSGAIYLVYE
ncbi:hypothetical protein [Intestinimonas butyriciproducens]|uniref:hypothetical protein n=1 Tax=Intestinimonas butyriciproducens TaxID=1297617 RepID=UPI0018AC0FE0|nr:hypothetical protein [Intestinimonas butyriciproducens]MDB7815689.1 hypothetical protein [Intestinimonas butyriciproducens]MDB7843541.1 hypothetical protein [Intestinimonas butyriciproducens]MDB7856711.1 hypothetical protein [Intestinimonas butyriciproducens]